MSAVQPIAEILAVLVILVLMAVVFGLGTALVIGKLLRRPEPAMHLSNHCEECGEIFFREPACPMCGNIQPLTTQTPSERHAA